MFEIDATSPKYVTKPRLARLHACLQFSSVCEVLSLQSSGCCIECGAFSSQQSCTICVALQGHTLHFLLACAQFQH